MEENMNKYEIKIYKEYCKYDCQTSELIDKYMYENGNKVSIYLPKQNITVTIKKMSYPEIYTYSDGSITVYLNGDYSNTSTQWFTSKKNKDELIKILPIVEDALRRLADAAECKTFTIEF